MHIGPPSTLRVWHTLSNAEFIPGPQDGHQYSVVKQKATKLCRIYNFSNRVIDDWNSLPFEVVLVEIVDFFNEKLHEHWKSEMYATPF